MSDFVALFSTTYNIIAMVVLFIGLVLCCIEFFIPGFGVFGITGTICLVFSIVFNLVMANDLGQFLYMLGIVVLVLAIVVVIAVRSARFGAISKSPLVQKGTALPVDYNSDEKNFAFLLGKEGVTLSVLKPVGKVEIDKLDYQVLTKGEYIEKGTMVKVVEVDGDVIIVTKI